MTSTFWYFMGAALTIILMAIGAEIVLWIGRKLSRKPHYTASRVVVDKLAEPQLAVRKDTTVQRTEVVLRKIWRDVEPAPFKVFVFADGKYEGVLVMHGPYEGVVSRLLLLWKGNKNRNIRLEALSGVDSASLAKVYETSLSEAKQIAQAVYGKKQKAKTVASSSEPIVPKPKAEAPPVLTHVVEQKSVAVAAPAVPKQAQQLTQPSVVKQEDATGQPKEVPIIKGFKAMFVGTVVSAGMQKHITTRNGSPEEYETYTLTLNTPSGPERITGNDLRRAIADANVKSGDNIRVIYIKDVELSNGFKKKQYQIVRMHSAA